MKRKIKKQWTQQEDQLIIEFVVSKGTKNWVLCVSFLKARTFKRTSIECRDRWFNYLDPNIERKPWSVEQHQKLFNLIETFGSKWSQISKILVGRTQNSIKNQFYSILRSLLKLISKIVRPSILSLIRSLTPHSIFLIYTNQIQKPINILKNILFNLQFQVYKKIVNRSIAGNQAALQQFFDQVETNYGNNKSNSSEISCDSIEKSEQIKINREKNIKSIEIQSQSDKCIKYFSVHAIIPIYLTQKNELKIGYEENLVNLLTKQLKQFDINYFLNN